MTEPLSTCEPVAVPAGLLPLDRLLDDFAADAEAARAAHEARQRRPKKSATKRKPGA